MYTNADVTLYLYNKEGKAEECTRVPIEGVYWEDVRQSTFLKTGQRDGTSVLLVIPLESLDGPIKLTQGKDLAAKDIIEGRIDCSSQETMSRSLAALKIAYGFLTVATVDGRLYGSESMQHYELACKQGVRGVEVELNIGTAETIKRNRGLQKSGPVQKLVDLEAMRYMSDYMPRRQAGELEHMMIMATVTGSGQIDIPGPYAHYLHEDILYMSPTTGSTWTKENEIKAPTDRELTYVGAPMRGRKWFDRMKADHKDDILQTVQASADRGGK